METQNAVAALGGLAQETRLKIYRELVKAHDLGDGEGGLAAGALAKKLKVPAPTLSFHLKEMSSAGLVISRRESRSIIYKADLEMMSALVNFLLEDCCGGACNASATCP